MSAGRDTIAAVATAPGSGGVGIVRLSGEGARRIGECLAGRRLQPRRAHHVRFREPAGEVVDDGIALYFAAPRSYTGEDVVELQAHGSPAVLARLLELAIGFGARHARAGEFSERAFLEGRLDLAQAEAVADLIAATDARAARAARRALDGEFSRRVDAVAAALLAVRVHVEAAIDFADEPLETLGGSELHAGIARIDADLRQLLVAAERGRRLRDGLHAVIIGPPNAGKSSLLNALAGSDRAIVTEIAGTTRDVLRETVRVGGVELTLVDTAGMREATDAVEREGIRRARAELARADLALVVVDAREPEAGRLAVGGVPDAPEVLWLANKCDLLAEGAAVDPALLPVSAMTGAGLQTLHDRLARLASPAAAEASEGDFTARQRHVATIGRALAELDHARGLLEAEQLDLAAEALRLAHDALGEITGRVHADDLLGHIFSSFCIGK